MPRPVEPLTEDQLYARALAIIDADGLDALTMRRLATSFGVKAPSLYNHVSGKEQLIEGALRLMRSELTLPDPVPDDWMSMMEAVLSGYRRLLTAHPNMMPLAGRRLPGDEHSGLSFLVDQGFSIEQAVELWQSMVSLVLGFSMFESGYTGGDADGLPPSLRSRAAEWRDETCSTALRILMSTYADRLLE